MDTARRLTLAFAALGQVAELCAARPTCPTTQAAFRAVLAKLEAELKAPRAGAQLSLVKA